jgi:hypothetical protein
MGAQQGGLARWRKDKDGGGGGGGGGAGAEGGAGESENKSAEGAARERGSSGGKGLPQLAVPEGMKKRNRRVSVSAEVDRDPNEKWVKKVSSALDSLGRASSVHLRAAGPRRGFGAVRACCC